MEKGIWVRGRGGLVDIQIENELNRQVPKALSFLPFSRFAHFHPTGKVKLRKYLGTYLSVPRYCRFPGSGLPCSEPIDESFLLYMIPSARSATSMRFILS